MYNRQKSMRNGLLLLLFSSAALSAQTVVVRPRPIDSVLVNPGMGIQTFQRFRNQDTYPGKEWSEVGPEKSVPDAKGAVEFPDSSMAYVRWFWHQLEPQRGVYRWDIIDSALDEARRHGQTLMIRLMPYDQKDPLPEWYRNSGARRANQSTDKDGNVWSPDSDDPRYAKLWSAVVMEAGKRYDGHPYLDSVDISTVGYWGEGWGPYLPSWSVQKELIDLYFKAFPRTRLLMNFDEPTALAYGTQHGAGWRLDCWGDMGKPGATFAHMLDMYPQQVARAGIGDVWRTAPVSLEVCWTPQHWKEWNFDLQYIFNQALQWHASTINLKSTRIPAEWKGAFDEFQKKIGYRYSLRRFEYPGKATAGRMAPLKIWWHNGGVSPVYSEYTPALRIGSQIVRLDSDPRKWLPGDAVTDQSIYIDPSLRAKTHKISVALLDPRTGAPAIKLANEGLQADGWYELGEITVE